MQNKDCSQASIQIKNQYTKFTQIGLEEKEEIGCKKNNFGFLGILW